MEFRPCHYCKSIVLWVLSTIVKSVVQFGRFLIMFHGRESRIEMFYTEIKSVTGNAGETVNTVSYNEHSYTSMCIISMVTLHRDGVSNCNFNDCNNVIQC